MYSRLNYTKILVRLNNIYKDNLSLLNQADGIFAVDALLAKPGAYIRDPVLWQWQDDKGNWHTYGYNDCRVIEAAHVAGKFVYIQLLTFFRQIALVNNSSEKL